MKTPSMLRRRALSFTSAVSVVAGVTVALAVTAGSAQAATPTGAPPLAQRDSSHVTADALPTVQIDSGVVWSQAVVGNTVYAGGEFTNTRPAGAAKGTNLTARSNLLAYDITTGNLISSFAPTVNGPVNRVVVSPDHTALYIAGSFTAVNGVARYRIAKFNLPSGTLDTAFKPVVSSKVLAVAATNSTVYFGGSFTSVGGVNRSNLAAVSATTGALTSWAPVADQYVQDMALTPDATKVFVAGVFDTMNGANAFGLADLDSTSGSSLPFPANSTVQAYHVPGADGSAGFYSIHTDNDSVYATAWNYNGGGDFEGTVRTDFSGNINWLEDCHGDTYDSLSTNGIIYLVGHAHYCQTVSGWGVTNPWTIQHSISFTKTVQGTVQHNTQGGYTDYSGNPAPSLYAWLPDFTTGTYTGKTQAAWSLAGNSQYVVEGGEFPTVNGVTQQGLVRFAVPSLAPKAQKPSPGGANFPLTTKAYTNGVSVSWPAETDRDDLTETYKLVRDGNTASPVYTTTANSVWWNRPQLSFFDAGLTPGSTHTYRVMAYDGDNNLTYSAISTITLPTSGPSLSAYDQKVISDGASSYWPMNDSSGSTAADIVGGKNLTLTSGVTQGSTGPVSGSTATTFNGSATGYTAAAITGPDTFTTSSWVKTTGSGKIIGFGDQQGSTSNSYDRHVYINSSGYPVFGVYPNSVQTLTGTAPVNDGQWHQIVASLGSSGMALYVDGVEVAQRSDVTNGQGFSGYWRIGGDNLNGWPNQGNAYLTGSIADVAVFTSVLTPAMVASEYKASGRSIAGGTAPTAAFTSTVSGLSATFDGTGSSDADGTVPSYAWDFGDGSSATSAAPTHPYTAAGTYHVTLTVTDDNGLTNAVTHDVTVVAPNQPPTAAFTSTVSGLTATFDGTGSSDSDGTVASYAWDFGDGNTGTGATPSYTYLAGGTYHVKLTVTDNSGATGSVTHDVTVVVPNQPPTAAFTSTSSGLVASFDGTGSSDSDGTIASYAWNFGDSSSGTGSKPSHTFTAAGTYHVTLTVTDDDGATNAVTNDITVTRNNVAPTAAFTSSSNGLAASFDGTGSSDSDGTVASYAWNFGDGSSATGATTSHTFAAAGTFTVTLTVTDNSGATASVSHDVAVAPANVLAQDAFNRTVAAGGLGSADVGGAWQSISSSNASALSVSPGTGLITVNAGKTPGAFLNVTGGDTNSTMTFSVDKPTTGTGTYVWLVARHHSNLTEYRLRIKITSAGAVALSIMKTTAGSDAALATTTISGLTFTPGTKYTLRFSVSGTSTVSLQGKIWATSATEPANWQVSATDSSSTIGSGGSGVLVSSSGATNAPLTMSLYALKVAGI